MEGKKEVLKEGRETNGKTCRDFGLGVFLDVGWRGGAFVTFRVELAVM
jgi:hypothetical protein